MKLSWSRNRGRDGWAGSPLQIREDMSAESRNVTLYNGGLGAKRGGSTAVAITGLTGPLNAAVEFVPAQDLTASELIVVDSSATTKIARCAAGSSFTSLTLKDNVATQAYHFSAVTLNGKLYCAYDSTVNRLHVFDPGYSTSEVRRAGLAPFAAAATVANTGAGTYAAVLRYYTTRSIEKQGSVVVRRSETNASVSFTPSGTGTAARITRPTAVNEGETHWEVYGSTDNVTFYGPLNGTGTAIATTTYDDSSDTTTWATTYDAEPSAGTHTPFPSVKFLGTTGSRLYGFGVWESSAGDSLAPKSGRFYIGPVLDSTSTHDDERINNTTSLQGWLDVSRNAGSPDRGLTRKPVNNVIYAFQSDQHFALVPTESETVPYRRVTYSGVGAVNNQSVVVADLRDGSSSVYFLDPVKGPTTQGGRHGLKWCGKDVKDIWDTFNADASTLPAWGLWYPDRNVLIFAIATGSNNAPDTMLVLDVTEQYLDEDGDLRGGWTVWTGDFANARCGLLYSTTLAATRSRTRTVYVGLNAGTFLKYDEAATADNGTAFQAYVTSAVLAAETTALEVQRSYLRASAQSGVTIQQSFIRNTGDETNRTSAVSLTATGSQVNVLRKFEDSALQDADTVQVTLGDASAAASAWSLLGWDADVKTGAPL